MCAALPAPRHGGQQWHGRVSGITRVAMSISMIVMLWASAPDDRWGIQTAVFAAATAWFLVLAAAGRQDRRERIGLVHQGIMMGSMLWMFLASSKLLSGSSMDMANMPGMNMPDTENAAVHATTIGFASYLVMAAMWWLWAGPRRVPASGGRVATARPAVKVRR
jgi:hypothetical protein